MTLKNLTYRIQRLFGGETCVVERVEPQSPFDMNHYWKDDEGNIPQRIFFRNPLGELVEVDNPMTVKSRDNFKGREDFLIYKHYKSGDSFP